MEAKPKPLIVAHRGAPQNPLFENTTKAFIQAFDQNADAVEGDFHLTADHRVVCHHNKTIRCFPIKKNSLKKLRTLKADLPTLEEVLSAIPSDKCIYIEIKSGVESCPFVLDIIDASKLKKQQIVIISFHADVIKTIKQRDSAINAYWLYQFERQEIPDIPVLLEKLAFCHADGIGTNINRYIDRDFIDQLKKAGYGHHAWTINRVKQARKLKEWGTLSITTDRVALIRKGLGE